MGPINWLAVVLAAMLANGIGFVWYGPLFGGLPPFAFMTSDPRPDAGPVRNSVGALFLFAFPALMLAHALARIGPDTLALKPWLYWMQSGGVAAFFVVPALWINHARYRASLREALVDGGFWLTAYLAMGTVFWALG